MKPLFVSRIQNNRGSALVTTVVISMVVLILSSSITNLILSWNKRTVVSSDRMALEVATRSSFYVMEAALKRRLWEVPLGTDCMKKSEFSVDLHPLEGMDIQVMASKEEDTKTISMVATGTFADIEVAFRKIIKISDASDFLLFSKGNSTVRLDRSYGVPSPAGLLAGPKRVYVEGPLVFTSSARRSSYAESWSSPPPMEIQELGVLLQGDRLLLAGGMSYGTRSVLEPNPTVSSSVPEYNLLHPLLDTYGTSLKAKGNGSTLVFSDYQKAKTLYDGLEAQDYTSLPPPSFYQDNIYPSSLFCGAAPLTSDTAVDSGCFINDINSSFAMTYTRDVALYGTLVDVSCFTTPGDKNCSSSKDFPSGFKAWRSSASLESTVYTETEVETIDFPPVGWDNLLALKEEAAVCGLVIDQPEASAFEDCDLADQNFLDDYVANGGTGSCQKISEVNMETLTGRISNLNLSSYGDSSLSNQHGRKVIYSTVPLSIAQTSAEGLWPSLGDPVARSNIPIWFVNESHFRLKPYQFNTTSPLDDSPATIRSVHFNDADPALGTSLNPLKMVMISPENLEVVSPDHIPYTLSDFQSMYPIVGGKVVPRQWALTDYQHQENDGFKYGVRRVYINNMVVVSNPGDLFSLRGLWSATDASAAKYLVNGCMMDAPSPAHPGAYETFTAQDIPAYASDPNPIIPPPSSRFYIPANLSAGIPAKVDSFSTPRVFIHQRNLFGVQSTVMFKGTRLNVGFENLTYLGKNLSSPKRRFLTRGRFTSAQTDLSNRSYTYNHTRYFEPTGAVPTPCTPATILEKSSLDVTNFSIWVNEGRFALTHESAEDNLSNIGAILAQPLMSTREK